MERKKEKDSIGKLNVKKDQRYSWCNCGESKKYPYAMEVIGNWREFNQLESGFMMI